MVGPGIWRETLKNDKKREMYTVGPGYGEKTDKEEKCEKHLVETRIWRETLKNMKN